MTAMRVSEIQHNASAVAIGTALRIAQNTYIEVRQGQESLGRMEASGIYSLEYLQDQREQMATSLTQRVEDRMVSARGYVQNARTQIDRSAALRRGTSDVSRYAAATAQLQMTVGDRVQDDPESLLPLYERLFDSQPDRLALEDLIEKVLAVLPEDDADRIGFEHRYRELADSLAWRLPEEEQRERTALPELDRSLEYTENVREYLRGYSANITTEPRSSANLTIYGKIIEYEREANGESIADKELPLAGVTP